MKKNFTNEQIIYTLRQVEGGTSVAEVCRKTGITEQRRLADQPPASLPALQAGRLVCTAQDEKDADE
jgi:hypothetical protein